MPAKSRNSKKVWRVIDILQWGEKYFEEHSFENSRREIELLVQEILNCKRVELYLRFEEPLSKEHLNTLRDWIQRRLKHEPSQYIIGKAGFYNVALIVAPGVLIPRPESEVVVDTVIKRIPKSNSATILDIGTGSGCIALSLAQELPKTHTLGIDISEEAIKIAQLNSENMKINNVDFRQLNILEETIDQNFDIVVSNPPYVPKTELKDLMFEVRDFEPHSALTDFADGLTFYRRFIEISSMILKPEGWFVLEVGLGKHPEMVKNLFVKDNFKNVELIKDYNGDWRVLIAQK